MASSFLLLNACSDRKKDVFMIKRVQLEAQVEHCLLSMYHVGGCQSQSQPRCLYDGTEHHGSTGPADNDLIALTNNAGYCNKDGHLVFYASCCSWMSLLDDGAYNLQTGLQTGASPAIFTLPPGVHSVTSLIRQGKSMKDLVNSWCSAGKASIAWQDRLETQGRQCRETIFI